MKKILTTLITISMLLTLGACQSNDSGNESENTQSTTSSITAAPPEDAPSQTDDKTDNTEDTTAEIIDVGEYVLIKETYTKTDKIFEYDYNADGYLIKETVFDGETAYIERVYTYTFNDDGSYSRSCEYTDLYADDTDTAYAEFDASGNMTYHESTDGNTYYYEYNAEGLLIHSYRINSRGKTLNDLTYEYDENGNLIRQIRDDGGYELYFYDENNKHIHTDTFFADGSQGDETEECYWEYEYDEAGRLITEHKIGALHGGTHEKYTYTYDEYSNVHTKHDQRQNVIYEYIPLSVYLSEYAE